MIQHVDKYPIYSIFDRDAKFYYFIPKYQRAYTWSYSEWGNLFDDLYENVHKVPAPLCTCILRLLL